SSSATASSHSLNHHQVSIFQFLAPDTPKMSTYFNTSSTYPPTPLTPSPLSSTTSLQISAPLTADIAKAGYVSIKDSWLWGKKYLVLRPITLSMYKNERIDGGTPQVVISLNDVINLKRE